MVHNYFYSFISILLIVVYETQCIAIRSHFSPVNMLNLISNVAGSPGVSQLLQNPQLAKLKEFVSQTPSTDSSAETQPNPVDEKEAAILQFLKNLTPEDIQSMNSEAASRSNENENLLDTIGNLNKEVKVAEKKVKKLESKGEFDKEKLRKRKKFQESISPEALYKSVASLGNEHEENGLFEAPIVFIQPTGLSLSEKHQLNIEGNCEDDIINKYHKIDRIQQEYATLKTDAQLESALKEAEKQLENTKTTQEKHLKQLEKLKKLANEGNADDLVASNIEQKVTEGDEKLKELQLEINLLRDKLKKDDTI